MQNVTEAKGEAEMTDAPDAARGVAGRLAEAFERDRGLAERQADRQPPANGSGENYRPLTLAPVRDGA